MRGTGSSIYQDPDSNLFSLDQYNEDANRILEQLQIDKVIVWSMAWGSRAAIAYCSKNVGRVNNAVLHDASIAKADPTAQKKVQKLQLKSKSPKASRNLKNLPTTT